MEMKKLLESFNHAIDGVIDAVRTQRNMKIHIISAMAVLIACFFFDISKAEFLALAITITMVITAELVNTAVEAVVDLNTNYYHPLAKVAKNTAAGAVLVTAINELLVGYIVFWDKLSNFSYGVIHKIKHSEPYMIFIALVIVVLTVVIVKAVFGEGTPLKGGMPSGHSALAFSISTAIALITEKSICIILAYLMAFITAQSRVDSEVHSLAEVIVGGIFGTLLTILIFTIFKI